MLPACTDRSEAREKQGTPAVPESPLLCDGLFTVLTPENRCFIAREQSKQLSRFIRHHGWGDSERAEGST